MASNLLVMQGPKILRPRQPTHTKYLEHPSGMRVELLDTMGDDLAIVNAARVSYGKESQWDEWYFNTELGIYTQEPYFTRHSTFNGLDYYEVPTPATYRLAKNDLGVLGYMMRERHGSPFEMVDFKFRVKAPIKVIWEWVRHRISSFNIMSTRYVEWDKDYYIPQAEEWRRQIGKPGRYTTEQITDGSQYHISVQYEKAMESVFNYYGILIDLGLHKEVAANVLPMGAMTEMIWKVNLRSLLNFLSLRNDEHALKEIQICATMVKTLAESIVPETFRLWNEYERKTP